MYYTQRCLLKPRTHSVCKGRGDDGGMASRIHCNPVTWFRCRELLSRHTTAVFTRTIPAWMIHVMCYVKPQYYTIHTHIYTHTLALKRTTILLAPNVISSSSVSYICTKRVSRYMVLFLFNTYYIVVDVVLYFLVSLQSKTALILFYIILSYMKLAVDKSRYYRHYIIYIACNVRHERKNISF